VAKGMSLENAKLHMRVTQKIMALTIILSKFIEQIAFKVGLIILCLGAPCNAVRN